MIPIMVVCRKTHRHAVSQTVIHAGGPSDIYLQTQTDKQTDRGIAERPDRQTDKRTGRHPADVGRWVDR